MVYLSWGEQRPMTRRAGHNASNSCLFMVPSARSTRCLNSGPVKTASRDHAHPLKHSLHAHRYCFYMLVISRAVEKSL